MFGHFIRRGPKPANVRLNLESLESRLAPATLNVPVVVASSVLGRPESATVAGGIHHGDRVEVWTQRVSAFDTDIFAQRFFANGNRNGLPIRVSFSTDPESEPDVCVDNNGNFDVVYTRTFGVNTHLEIARFGAAGNFIERLIVPSTNSFDVERDAHIACSATGDFVISYTQATAFGDQDVLARMYTLVSGRARETRLIFVANQAGIVENDSDVAHTAGVPLSTQATFAVVYVINGNVYARRYNSAGNLLNPNNPALRIADRFFTENNPSIAVNAFNKFVVAWQQQVVAFGDSNISARTFDANGVLGLIRDLRTVATDDTAPEVAFRNNGRFVVSYRSEVTGSFVFQVNVTEVRENGATFTAPTQTVVSQSFTGPIVGLSTLSVDPTDTTGAFFIGYTQTSGTGIAGNLFVQLRRFA
jgi:hypothetical protein